MGIKNLWSLNVDEAILSEKVGKELGKEYQIFFPVNSQLKDIDLIIYNLKTQKTKSIQVKGSRTYVSKRLKKLGISENAKTSWNVIKSESIFSPTNEIDFFIFVLHQEDLKSNSRQIVQNYIIIPIKDFRDITKKEKEMRKTGHYHYAFAALKNKAIEVNNVKNKQIDFTKYLNNFDLLKL